MSWSIALFIAAALAFGLKLLGHLVPIEWLEHRLMVRTAELITVGLLASMVASQAFTTGTHVVLDARVSSLAVAAVLFWRKVPFVVVVIVAAAVAAGLRALGWG
jgi:C4-dicarboxylate transporter